MTLAHKEDHLLDPTMLKGSSPTSGRERRVHHRREAGRVWAHVDGGWYKVHDLSLGGFGLDRPVERPDIGTLITGEIHSRAGNRNWHSSFEATVVRVDEDDNRIGVAFAPLGPDQIDGLLAILSAVEREFVDNEEAALRYAAFVRRLKRFGVAILFIATGVALGSAAWFMR